jgi:hypothetical protein
VKIGKQLKNLDSKILGQFEERKETQLANCVSFLKMFSKDNVEYTKKVRFF